jgi:GNAT superfamily N-acetyltransferase
MNVKNVIIGKLDRQDAINIHLPNLLKITNGSGYDESDIRSLTHIFIATYGNEIIGFAGLACYHGFWTLRICVVGSKYRGNGIQRALISVRENYLRSIKAKHVNVWVKPTNIYSLNNLVSCGFRFVKEKPRAFHGHEHIKLRKEIKQF